MNKTSNILKHVEFLDLVRIHVYRAPPEKNEKMIDFLLGLNLSPWTRQRKLFLMKQN